MSFGIYAIGFVILTIGLDLRRVLAACAGALDCRWRDRAYRRWHSLRCQSDASEGPSGLSFVAR